MPATPALSPIVMNDRGVAVPDRRALILPAAVAVITLTGFLIRLAAFDQSLLGDELSTFWILDGSSLGEVLSSIRSDDEITPPLYFVLGWASLELGPGPEWVRLPSLLAGTATIPLVYLLGARTLGRLPGLAGAAIFALSPFMIYYATEARSYAVMIALLTASTLALLIALESGRTRWWGLYGACTVGAMLTHYTVVFPLLAQFAWALWAHREAVRPLLWANLGAAVAFAPWIPGFVADNNSPTTEILDALQPFTFSEVRTAVEHWAVGYPYVRLDFLPGEIGLVMICVGITLGLGAAAVRAARFMRRSRPRFGAQTLRGLPTGPVLVVLLAISTPLGEAIFSAFSTNLFGARNLNASWPGFALVLGGLVSAAGPWLGPACAVLVLSGFGIAAAKTLDRDVARPDYEGAARLIEERAAPGDVVVDAAPLTPVPRTGLDVFLAQRYPEYRLGLPITDHPFTVYDRPPPAGLLIRRAIEGARGRKMFVVTYQPEAAQATVSAEQVANFRRARLVAAGRLLHSLPQGYEVIDREPLPGVNPLLVFVVEDRSGGS